MSNVGILRNDTTFQATPPIISDVGSATDVRLTDLAQAADEAGTDPFVKLLTVGPQYWFSPGLPRIAEDVSSTGSPNLLILFSAAGERRFFANMSDFGTLDEFRTPEGQIQRQIRSLRGTPRLIYRERLARRLEFLLDAMKEEGEAWNVDSPESLRMMLLFLQAVPNFRCPTVTVTPSATFRAQWTVEPNRHFAVDFLPDGQVRFVVFCPDLRRPDRIQRISGITSRENLINVVGPYKVHHWAVDAGTKNPR